MPISECVNGRSRAGRGTALDGLLPDQDEAYQ